MSKKFFVKNSTPTVEKKIFSQDGSDSCIIAFDRYSRTELMEIFESYNKINQEENYIKTLIDFISAKIKYIKDVSLTSYEFDSLGEPIEGSETIIVVDTRTTVNEAWTTPVECKQFVLDIFFDSFSWGADVFIKAFNDHIADLTGQGKEEEVKN